MNAKRKLPPPPSLSPAEANARTREIIAQLRELALPEIVVGQRRFGITPTNEHLGVSVETLRKIARPWRGQQGLADALWQADIHEARLLASMTAHPQWMDRSRRESWILDVSSWDLCDQLCGNLLDRTNTWEQCVRTWILRPETFVRRAGFVLIATAAVHRKELPDAIFGDLISLVTYAQDDNRNFVRKGVSWALRQVGKRSQGLRKETLRHTRILRRHGSPAALWICRDVERELDA